MIKGGREGGREGERSRTSAPTATINWLTFVFQQLLF